MASEAKLLRHHPGTVTSIEIPMNNGSFGEISFKSIVNALVAKSKTEEASSSATSSISAATLPQIPKLKEGRHRSNPYDNIIEKLERKYTSHMIIGDEEGSEEDEEIDEPGEEAGVTDIKTAKKKKKSNPYDAYDLNDSFVDDSDEIAQVTAELKKRKLRTVHGGFFVSSGELEVEKDLEIQSKRRVASNHSANVTNKNASHSVPASSVMLISDRIKIDKVPELLAKGPKGDPGDKGPILVADGVKKTDPEGGVKVPRVRVIRPKPLWAPSLSAISALETFKEACRAGSITIGKNGIVPQQLEPLLLALDRTVRAAHSDTLNSTSGFVESVVEILGGDASTAKIKNVLAKLRHKELSSELKSSKENLLKQLLVLIKENTVAMAGEGGKSCDPDPDIAACMSPVQDKVVTAAAASTALPTHTDKEKDSPIPIPVQVQGPSSAPPLLPSSDSTAVSTSAPTSPNAAAPVKEYDWQVRWSLPMKITLCEFEVSVTKWVSGENAYRTRITAHEKRYLDETEYEELVEKDEMVLAMKSLLAVYPPSCRHADVSSLKKMIALEKQRVKKKIARLLAAQAVATSDVLTGTLTPANAAPTSSSSSSSTSLLPSTTPSSASTLSKPLPAPSSVPAQKKTVISTGNVNSPSKIQLPISTKTKEIKKKVVKSHKKVTKKLKSILATNEMLSLTRNLSKPKKNKNPLRARIATTTTPATTTTIPVTIPLSEIVVGTVTGAGVGVGVVESVCGDFLINDIGGPGTGAGPAPVGVLQSSIDTTATAPTTVAVTATVPVTATVAVIVGDAACTVLGKRAGTEIEGGTEDNQKAAVENTVETVEGASVGEAKQSTPTKQKKKKVIKLRVQTNLLKDKTTEWTMSPKMSAAVFAAKRLNSVAACVSGSLPLPLPLSYSVSSATLDTQESQAVQPSPSSSTPASGAGTAVSSTAVTKAITAKKGIVTSSNTVQQSSSVSDAAATAGNSTGSATISATIIIAIDPPPSTTVSQTINPPLTPSLLTSTGISTESRPPVPPQASNVTAATVTAKRVKPSKNQSAAGHTDSEGGAGVSEGKKKRKRSHTGLCVVPIDTAVAVAAATEGEVALSGTAAADSSFSSVPGVCDPPSCIDDTETPLKGSAASTPNPTPGESPGTSVAATGDAITPQTSSIGSNRGGTRHSSMSSRRDSESAEDTVISSAEVTDDETPERGESFTIPPCFNIGDFTLL